VWNMKIMDVISFVMIVSSNDFWYAVLGTLVRCGFEAQMEIGCECILGRWPLSLSVLPWQSWVWFLLSVVTKCSRKLILLLLHICFCLWKFGHQLRAELNAYPLPQMISFFMIGIFCDVELFQSICDICTTFWQAVPQYIPYGCGIGLVLVAPWGW